MVIISPSHSIIIDSIKVATSKFSESQKLRMEYLAALKAAGDELILIRRKLKEAKASANNPVETDMGTFTSFANYLETCYEKDDNRAYEYIKLAENWHIVEALGMQDRSNQAALAKSMRLARTLKIIKWAQTKIELGIALESLSLDLYWEEEESRRAESSTKKEGQPTYKELLKEVYYYKKRVEELETELISLKHKLVT